MKLFHTLIPSLSPALVGNPQTQHLLINYFFSTVLHGPDCYHSDQSTPDPKMADESQRLDLNIKIKEEDVDNFMYLSEY